MIETEAKASCHEIYKQYCLEVWIDPQLTQMLNNNVYQYNVQKKIERTRSCHRRRAERFLNRLSSQGFVPSPNKMNFLINNTSLSIIITKRPKLSVRFKLLKQ